MAAARAANLINGTNQFKIKEKVGVAAATPTRGY
jgi:hypothetical protein